MGDSQCQGSPRANIEILTQRLKLRGYFFEIPCGNQCVFQSWCVIPQRIAKCCLFEIGDGVRG